MIGYYTILYYSLRIAYMHTGWRGMKCIYPQGRRSADWIITAPPPPPPGGNPPQLNYLKRGKNFCKPIAGGRKRRGEMCE